MEEFEQISQLAHIEISWARWIIMSLLVFLFYWIIRIANSIFQKASLLGGWKVKVHNVIHKMYVLAEPIALLIIIGGFIFINPIVHGIIALFLALISYELVKSYFSGKVLQLNEELFVGQNIKVQNSEGFIQEIGRTNLSIQTKQGVEYISFAQLFQSGYTQMQGDKIGGLQALLIEGTEEEKKLTIQNIKDRLWETPYLDWSFNPEVNITNVQNQFEVKVLLREKTHLEDFKNLINEWGYTCRLKK